ncbi:putative ATP-dependent endonuclease of OLD family [Micromonospora sp. Llam0]|uniref:ATP-dependent nuclease n=1 Tax=Micromonospora sp. Llam0 TaxID=2485143 RepID=UPI000F490DD0|nr:AAA family ATPase [Micromonospora sp. Llam0]ROO63104.1 putative ATP-dependent endonuclease of OLD family [Micromonospora sp. Llam0]
MSTAPTALSAPTTGDGMYLAGLRLTNFRSCRDVEIKLQPGLTLLVGDNNSGKSNVIDAIRLLTTPLSGRRVRYLEADDVSTGADGPIEIVGEFDGLTRFQQGQYIGALDLATNKAYYMTRFRPDMDVPRRSKVENLVGRAAGSDAEPEKRDQIRHVYLAPLRDAKRELDSATGNRMALIIKYLTSEASRTDFLDQAIDGLRKLEEHDVITGTQKRLQEHVSDLTDPVRGQVIGLSFRDVRLQRLARGLRLKMAEHGVDLADIEDSGLGYANLLYMASVIIELRNAQDAELTLFLVEEPEAHLHPQLQAVLLDYLQEQSAKSLRDDTDGPAGRIQVVATTHSPNLASAVGIRSIVVLRTQETQTTKGSPVAEAEEAPTGVQRGTAAIALCDIDLTDEERRKIDQYLDVSRAELLFTRRAILVEGVSEAVILPPLARHCVFDRAAADYGAKCREFRAVSIISIGSVDFGPYLKLLLQQVNGVRLVDRLVVITDGDPDIDDEVDQDDGLDDEPEAVEPETEDEPAATLSRKDRLEEIATQLGADSILAVFAAEFTLEADLMNPFTVNGPLLETAFKRQKPRSGRFWNTLAMSTNPAEVFYRKLRTTKRYIGKGEFAHDVAELIQSGGTLKCPAYLAQAIQSAMR